MPSKKSESFFCLFTTALGPSAIAWSNERITGLFLPEETQGRLFNSLKQLPWLKQSDKIPPTAGKAIEQIQNYFAGQPYNFKRIKIDLSACPPFHQKIYTELQKIPAGCTISYKALAAKCDNPDGSRAAGQAVGKNPIPLLVPCHRVIKSDGTLGGFSAAGGLELKAKMLELESLEISRKPDYAIKPPLLLKDCNLTQAIAHLSKNDPELGKFITMAPRFNLVTEPMISTFQALLEAIVYQQLTGKAAATIFSRVLALFARAGTVAPLDIIRADEQELRSAGLSGGKIAAARDLAEFAISGRLPDLKNMQRMANNDIINCLTQIRGIGRWTVEMLLIFKLGRADIMACNDYGLQKGLSVIRNMQGLPAPHELEEQAIAWRPYRSIAAWYLWRAAESIKSA